MPLSVEFYHPRYEKWGQVAVIQPGKSPVVMPQIMPDGERKVYALECDQTDGFSSISTYDVPEVLRDEEIGLVNLEEMDPKSVVTVPKEDTYYLSVKSNQENCRLVVRFVQG